jgi:hypothetical protein
MICTRERVLMLSPHHVSIVWSMSSRGSRLLSVGRSRRDFAEVIN